MRRKYRFSLGWSIIWVLIHAFSFGLMWLILNQFDINEGLKYYVLSGLGVTVIANIVRIFTRRKRFIINKWFVFHFIINTFSIWLGLLISEKLGIEQYLIHWIIIGFLIMIFGVIIRMTKLYRSVFLISVILIAILFFNNTDIDYGGVFDSSQVEDLDESEATVVQKVLYNPPERKAECMQGIEKINAIRKQNNRNPLEWDDKLYELAVSQSQDMYERNYFDHTTPEGKCVKDFKADYGFAEYIIADNVGAQYSGYDTMSFDTTINVDEQVSGWLESRGHRYNLLYVDHIKGVIGCYYGVCVFLGAHTDPYGLGAGPCTTGDEGLAYWETIEKQPGEI